MKRIISALLSATLLAGVAAMPAAAEETYSLGDVTMDGVVDTMDAGWILGDFTEMIFFDEPDFSIDAEGHILTDQQLVYADVTNDGYVDVGDTIAITQYCTYVIITGASMSLEEYLANEETYYNEVVNSENYKEVADRVTAEAYQYAGDALDASDDTETPVDPEGTYSLGDVNMDGVVDVADVIDTLVHYTRVDILGAESELTEQQMRLANVDYVLTGDNAIDTHDAIWIVEYYTYTLVAEDPMTPEAYFAALAAEARIYALGDVNMDGVVNAIDSSEIMIDYTEIMVYSEDGDHSIYAEGHRLTGEQFIYADVDANGEIDLGDAVWILSYYTYTLIAETTMSIEEFMADYETYESEMINAENFQEISERVIAEGQAYIDGRDN